MSKKFLTLVLLLLFLALIPLIIYFLQRQVQYRGRAAGQGVLSFNGPASVAMSTPFQVQIIANTSSASIQSRGVDIQISFDRTRLQLNNITPNTAINLKTFLPVDASNNFNVTTVKNNANASGVIEFGAVPAIKTSLVTPAPTTIPGGTPTPAFQPMPAGSDYFAGSVVIATLDFTPLVAGTATLNYVHTVDNKNDSNIASFDLDTSGLSYDLLGTVTNYSVSVTGGATATPTSGVSCPRGDLGNLNCGTDGLINATDLSILLSKWAPAGPVPTPNPGHRSADIAPNPPDGRVNSSDLSKMLANWGSGL